MNAFEALLNPSMMDTLKTYRTGTSLTAFPQTNPPSAPVRDDRYYLDVDRDLQKQYDERLAEGSKLFNRKKEELPRMNEFGSLAIGAAAAVAAYKFLEAADMPPLGTLLASVAAGALGHEAATRMFNSLPSLENLGPRITSGSEATNLAYEAAMQSTGPSKARLAAEYRAETGALEMQAALAEMQAQQASLQAARALQQAASVQLAMKRGYEAGKKQIPKDYYPPMPTGGRLDKKPDVKRYADSTIRIK